MASNAHKRTDIEREADKNFIIDLHMKGYGIVAIANRLCEVRPYSITPNTVYTTINKVLDEYHKLRIKNMDKQISLHIMKIERLIQLYYEGYERSLKNKAKQKEVRGGLIEVTDTEGNTKQLRKVQAIREEEQRDGGIQWLNRIEECYKEIAKLLGFYRTIVDVNVNDASSEVREIHFTTKPRKGQQSNIDDAEIVEDDTEMINKGFINN